MTPIDRAKCLYSHAKHSGAPLSEFVLELTDHECWSELDNMANDSTIPINHELLKLDIAAARAKCDPWPIMNNFTIGGFIVVKRQGELH